MLNKNYKSEGGLHTKGKTGKGKTAIGVKSSAKSAAKKGNKIVLGSMNAGKSGRLDSRS